MNTPNYYLSGSGYTYFIKDGEYRGTGILLDAGNYNIVGYRMCWGSFVKGQENGFYFDVSDSSWSAEQIISRIEKYEQQLTEWFGYVGLLGVVTEAQIDAIPKAEALDLGKKEEAMSPLIESTDNITFYTWHYYTYNNAINNSHKYWGIAYWKDNKTGEIGYRTHWGRIGTVGQFKDKIADDDDNTVGNLRTEKENKGYKLCHYIKGPQDSKLILELTGGITSPAWIITKPLSMPILVNKTSPVDKKVGKSKSLKPPKIKEEKKPLDPLYEMLKGLDLE